jgi:protein-S-isoprenylcysteine O-methyltransferase Ste14
LDRSSLLSVGLVFAIWTCRLFVTVGEGTPAPWDPPNKLVVHGPYRHVRNPIFTGVLAILLGEAAVARSPALLAWFALFFALLAVAVPRIGEPRLARKFGADYARYRQHVPRWLPRPRPWSPPPSSHQHS